MLKVIKKNKHKKRCRNVIENNHSGTSFMHGGRFKNRYSIRAENLDQVLGWVTSNAVSGAMLLDELMNR